jgi:hypothetical protein
MKKLSVLFICLLVANMMFAQAKKKVVLIGDVKCGYENSKPYSDNVHDVIVQAFVEKALHEVIDINTLSAVDKEFIRMSGERGLNEDNFKNLQDARIKGANFIITGTLSNYDAIPVKNDKGELVGYNGKLNFIFKVTNFQDGTQKGTANIACTTLLYQKTKDAAIMKAITNAKKKVIKEIIKIFPPSAPIVEITSTKKNAAKTLVLEIGAGLGIQKGDIFKVCEKKKYRGKIRIVEIGKVKVTSVQGDDFCECKVTKGGDVILKDFNEEKEIFAEQLPKRPGGIGGALGSAVGI